LGDKAQTQHLGLDKRLLTRAKELARGYQKLAVISSIGTRQYYQKYGFKQGELYQYLELVD
jgi:elongator complex protein 3